MGKIPQNCRIRQANCRPAVLVREGARRHSDAEEMRHQGSETQSDERHGESLQRLRAGRVVDVVVGRRGSLCQRCRKIEAEARSLVVIARRCVICRLDRGIDLRACHTE